MSSKHLLDLLLTVIQSRTNWTRQQAEMLLGVLALSGAILVCGLILAVGSALGQPPMPTAVSSVLAWLNSGLRRVHDQI